MEILHEVRLKGAFMALRFSIKWRRHLRSYRCEPGAAGLENRMQSYAKHSCCFYHLAYKDTKLKQAKEILRHFVNDLNEKDKIIFKLKLCNREI